MRIRLHEKFDWKIPGKRAMQAFPVGDHTMTHEAGEEAIRLGKGVEIDKPKKSEGVLSGFEKTPSGGIKMR